MIAQTSVVVRYIVTAGVLSYAVPFPIYSEKDVRVTFSTDGRTETALVLGADYTVTVLSSGGGTVTLHSAGIVPAGAVLAVASAIPATQEADFSATTDVDTGALETQLDRQVQMIQQLEADLDRAVKVPAASEDTPEEVVQSVYAARDAAADSATDAARNAAEAGQSALAAAHSEQEAAASAADAAASADLAQSLTEVGPATSERLGFVRIGQGISVDETGLISVPLDGANLDIISGLLNLSERLQAELEEQEFLRKLSIGAPKFHRSTVLPDNHAWPDVSFIEFEDWPEFYEIYEQGGFTGLVMPWDADTEEQAANLGKFRPDAANPTGLYLPLHGGQFFRNWVLGQEREAGAWQGDTLKSHAHEYLGHHTLYGGASGNYSAVLQYTQTRTTDMFGESETRPVNIAQPVIIYLGRPR